MKTSLIALAAVAAIAVLPSRAAAQSGSYSAGSKVATPSQFHLNVDFGAGLRPKPGPVVGVGQLSVPSPSSTRALEATDCQMLRQANPNIDPAIIKHPAPGREYFIRVTPVAKCSGR